MDDEEQEKVDRVIYVQKNIVCLKSCQNILKGRVAEDSIENSRRCP